MERLIVYFAFLAIIATPTIGWSDIEEWEFPNWMRHFHMCGEGAQTVAIWPGLGLVDEYRSLKKDMLQDALEKGANADQLFQLSEAFEQGRRQAEEKERREDVALKDLDKDELNEIIDVLRQGRNFCSDY